MSIAARTADGVCGGVGVGAAGALGLREQAAPMSVASRAVATRRDAPRTMRAPPDKACRTGRMSEEYYFLTNPSRCDRLSTPPECQRWRAARHRSWHPLKALRCGKIMRCARPDEDKEDGPDGVCPCARGGDWRGVPHGAGAARLARRGRAIVRPPGARAR